MELSLHGVHCSSSVLSNYHKTKKCNKMISKSMEPLCAHPLKSGLEIHRSTGALLPGKKKSRTAEKIENNNTNNKSPEKK